MDYKTHRSIRAYTEAPVSQEVLDTLLTAGIRASNTGNIQSYSVIVTQEEEMKARLAPLHFNQPMVKGAPVLLTFCVDYNRLSAWSEARGTACGHLNLMGFYNASLDAMLFAQNVAVAAEDAGLGYCFLGTVLYNLESIIHELALPRGVIPILTMSLGYPAETPSLRPRLSLEGVVHYERYSPFTPAQIEALYAPLENDPYYQDRVRTSGCTNLAQLIMEKEYPAANYMHLSQEIVRILQLQGFEEKCLKRQNPSSVEA